MRFFASGLWLAVAPLCLAGCGGSDSTGLGRSSGLGGPDGGGLGGSGGAPGTGGASAGGRSAGGASSGGTSAGGTGLGGTGAGGAAATGGQSAGGATSTCISTLDCPENADCIGGTCVSYTPCNNSLDCPPGSVCNAAQGRCADCVTNADCSPGQTCGGGKCLTVTTCTSDKQCTPLGELCDATLGHCVECLASTDCPTGSVCSGGACAAATCAAGKKFCNGKTVEQCDAAGTSATVVQTCASGEYCDPATTACRAMLCVPGAPACNGTRATTCNAAGTGYVAGGTDCAAAGQTCVLGECKTCGAATGPSPVRLKEVFVGTPEYLVLENPSGCPADLGGLTLSFNTSYASGAPSDFALPSQTLDPGSTVVVVDGTATTPAPGEIGTTSNIDWQAAYGGYVLLCNGSCSTPTNAIDALAFQGGSAPPPFPGVISFDPALTTITSSNEQTDSFQRVALKGVYPGFLPSDWTTGKASQSPCPATQPSGACTQVGLVCSYGAVSCTCTLDITSTFSIAWACQ